MHLGLPLALLLAAAPDAPSREARARLHHEAAKLALDRHQTQRAVREWTEAYGIDPNPAYLLNIGQVWRRQGDLRHAKDAYLKFLATAPPETPGFESAQTVVHELDAELATQAAKRAHPRPEKNDSAVIKPAAPPAPVTEVAQSSTPAPPPTVAESGPGGVSSDRPEDEPKPRLVPPTPTPPPDPVVQQPAPSPAVHLAWAIPVGVVVVAGAVVGVWAATRPAPNACAGAGGLGCFDARTHP